MDPDVIEIFKIVGTILPFVAIIVAVSVAGWALTTWLRIKNGYPLDGKWGQALHPSTDKEAIERIKLLSSENAQLRAELGSIKDRLETVERVITDQPSRLAREIDLLGHGNGGRA